jgi:hypothetical protein
VISSGFGFLTSLVDVSFSVSELGLYIIQSVKGIFIRGLFKTR